MGKRDETLVLTNERTVYTLRVVKRLLWFFPGIVFDRRRQSSFLSGPYRKPALPRLPTVH